MMHNQDRNDVKNIVQQRPVSAVKWLKRSFAVAFATDMALLTGFSFGLGQKNLVLQQPVSAKTINHSQVTSPFSNATSETLNQNTGVEPTSLSNGTYDLNHTGGLNQKLFTMTVRAQINIRVDGQVVDTRSDYASFQRTFNVQNGIGTWSTYQKQPDYYGVSTDYASRTDDNANSAEFLILNQTNYWNGGMFPGIPNYSTKDFLDKRLTKDRVRFVSNTQWTGDALISSYVNYNVFSLVDPSNSQTDIYGTNGAPLANFHSADGKTWYSDADHDLTHLTFNVDFAGKTSTTSTTKVHTRKIHYELEDGQPIASLPDQLSQVKVIDQKTTNLWLNKIIDQHSSIAADSPDQSWPAVMPDKTFDNGRYVLDRVIDANGHELAQNAIPSKNSFSDQVGDANYTIIYRKATEPIQPIQPIGPNLPKGTINTPAKKLVQNGQNKNKQDLQKFVLPETARTDGNDKRNLILMGAILSMTASVFFLIKTIRDYK
ncbi:hypothetical protein [Fructobacillus parabroussonetiae]|uniref:Uncharacterized protein n=1 Tax=Fructobacillus parabroussonetiae TaxID=2713174 RepID=A0ABS5QZ36_9LACO|nr:hypothetical protein [Fructobacillus parabroussonetiae]MBS9337910.1 hypothetical protein [Fructobacillus parabroussonetiae]